MGEEVGQEEEEEVSRGEEEETQDPIPLPEATEGAAVEEARHTVTVGELQQQEEETGAQTAPSAMEGRGLEP